MCWGVFRCHNLTEHWCRSTNPAHLKSLADLHAPLLSPHPGAQGALSLSTLRPEPQALGGEGRGVQGACQVKRRQEGEVLGQVRARVAGSHAAAPRGLQETRSLSCGFPSAAPQVAQQLCGVPRLRQPNDHGLTSIALRMPNTNAPTRPAGGLREGTRPARHSRKWPALSLSQASDGASAWKRQHQTLATPPHTCDWDASSHGQREAAWLGCVM